MTRGHDPSSTSQWARFLLLHASLGAALGILVGAALLITDVVGIGTLFWESGARMAIGALYFVSFASTFAAGSVATAIMGLARKDR
jgi:hypothetical protein